MKNSIPIKNVDDYIDRQPAAVKEALEKLRRAIKKAAPKAEEVISYGMPAYKYLGMIAYFAAHKNHIGFYAMPGPIKAFKKELTGYKTSKGTVQFPWGEPLPLGLIGKMVTYRKKENEEKDKLKKIKKKK
jgi:uncharacterized protein YdhG (YjbR/CyaY superfamily)